MTFLLSIWDYIIVFLIVLTIIVFVHELGHYLIARLNGVRISVFSIGFGPELFGWTDKTGTRWRFSLLPLGGYVRMFGDADASSSAPSDAILTPEEQKFSFHHKSPWQRALISFAGPAANLLFAFIGMALFFMILGQQIADPVIGEVIKNGPADKVGLMPKDRILKINGANINRFDDIQKIVLLDVSAKPLELEILRGGKHFVVSITPQINTYKGLTRNTETRPILGIQNDPSAVHLLRHSGLGDALRESAHTNYQMVSMSFVSIGQMLNGSRSARDLGGPITIARTIGLSAQAGVASTVYFMMMLSLNLGIFNLFPIPILDGGQIVTCVIEMIIRRPLNQKIQEAFFRIGLLLVLALMVFVTFNDVRSLPLIQNLKHFF